MRTEFTKTHDDYLIKYLARYCPNKVGRSGRKVFDQLVANEKDLWPWSGHHTAQSWRERYVKNSSHFDVLIAKYQVKHDIKTAGTRKRGTGPTPIEMLNRRAKRAKLDAKREEEEGPSSETRAGQSAVVPHASAGSKPSSKPMAQQPHEPDVQPSPQRPSTSTNTETTIIDITSKVSVSPRSQQPLPLTNDKPEPPPPPAKQLKKRYRSPSEVFASEPSTPKRDTAVVRVAGPSQPTPPAPSTDTGAPASTPTYLRALPRIVDSFHGQVLVDGMGRIPRAFPLHREDESEEEDEPEVKAEEEQAEDGLQWPPLRGRAAKERKTNGPDVEIDPHHAFSQLIQPPGVPGNTPNDERRRQTPHQVCKPIPLLDRRSVVARFLGEVGGRGNAIPQVKSGHHEGEARNGTSPIQHIVPPTPSSVSSHIPEPSPKVSKPSPPRVLPDPFQPQTGECHGDKVRNSASPTQHTIPPPSDLVSRRKSEPLPKVSSSRLSPDPFRQSPVGETCHQDRIQNGTSPTEPTIPPTPDLVSSHGKSSPKASTFPSSRVSPDPFQPQSPVGEIRQPSHPQPKHIKAARHPALSRIRQQAIENDKPDKRARSRRREHVPSIDLVALSRSSTSARSHSSTDSSAPARPPRWSLPAMTHVSPWADTRGVPSAPGSVVDSGWASPMLGRGRLSMPQYAFTPSPVRALATEGALDAETLAHPRDLPLTSLHGLASLLTHMAANHGLALGVVEAVYRRVGSLSEADEVLKGMREAAEGFGEREIERRMALRRRRRRAGELGRQATLRYVVASEDGEGSDYSPPETSRAALWKRQLEHAEEGQAEHVSAEHHAFSRCVMALEDDANTPGTRHTEDRRVERALVQHLPAQELEQEMGRGQFRRDIAKRFAC